jgi:hypothetical protein
MIEACSSTALVDTCERGVEAGADAHDRGALLLGKEPADHGVEVPGASRPHELVVLRLAALEPREVVVDPLDELERGVVAQDGVGLARLDRACPQGHQQGLLHLTELDPDHQCPPKLAVVYWP